MFSTFFDDQDLKLDEQKTLYKKLNEGKNDKKQLKEKMKRAGQILIGTNLDVEEYEIFELFRDCRINPQVNPKSVHFFMNSRIF